jgi:hypothetical protein
LRINDILSSDRHLIAIYSDSAPIVGGNNDEDAVSRVANNYDGIAARLKLHSTFFK